MENETQSVSNEAEMPQPTRASPASESPKAKAAETRLKEMSKRTKQKGKVSEPKTKSNSLPLFNTNWFYIGMGVAGIVGISYLVFRTPTKTECKFVPKKPPFKKTLRSTNLSPIPEEPEKAKSDPKFELNSF